MPIYSYMLQSNLRTKDTLGTVFFVLSSEVVPISEFHHIFYMIIISKVLWMNFMLSVGGEIVM